MKKGLLALMLLVATGCGYAQDLKLWYSKPAASWSEALPVGNSHMGAMVFGGTDSEE